jgi:phytol kinase
MWFDSFFSNKLIQDIVATSITFAVALTWLRVLDALAHRGIIEQRLSRKIIHIGTGPLFVLCWNLFSAEAYARYLAALVPLAITAQFVMVGLGLLQDEGASDFSPRALVRTLASAPRQLSRWGRPGVE